MTSPSVPLEERFWRQVDKSGECWLWTGALAAIDDVTGDGYGHIAYRGKHYGTHRLSYEWAKGSIPPGLHVCHTCDVRRCVNPTHLWVGTHRDNVRDASVKGRMHSGEANGIAKLTAIHVSEILRDYRPIRGSLARLARKYGVTAGTIRFVIRRQTWRHVEAAV